MPPAQPRAQPRARDPLAASLSIPLATRPCAGSWCASAARAAVHAHAKQTCQSFSVAARSAAS
eukprot:366054-Chlamydomonas_euryale.AAC.6